MIYRYLCLLLFAVGSFALSAQQVIPIDRIIAVVGGNPVLESDLEMQCQQLKLSGENVTPELKVKVLEQLMYRKLLLHQAQLDSIEVKESEVEERMDRNFRYFIAQFGSVEEFEKFYGKTVAQYKEEFRNEIKEMLLAQKMEQKILGNVTVSPNEVRNYFNSLHKDSIPLINAEIEIGQLVRKPKENPELKNFAKQKLEEIRQRAIKGEDFDFLVKAYNEDPGSNGRSGAPIKYVNIPRGQFVPEFDQFAFSMKPGDISPVFETVYGFHVMKLLARKGEVVDLQHILITVPIDPNELKKAKLFLDSLVLEIKMDSISFSEAASRFSDDEESAINGGKIINPSTGDTKFEMNEISQIDPSMVLIIEKLDVKQISEPTFMQTRDAKQAYRIMYIFSKTEPHKANLKEDYLRLQNEAIGIKHDKLKNDWVNKKLKITYVKIHDDYKDWKFESNWITVVK